MSFDKKLPTIYPTKLPTIYSTGLPTIYPTKLPATLPTILPTIPIKWYCFGYVFIIYLFIYKIVLKYLSKILELFFLVMLFVKKEVWFQIGETKQTKLNKIHVGN